MTGDWKYDRSKLRLKDRIDQKYNHERSVPLKFRTLAETLNPQPDAHVVFQRLLDFIERCDIASQLGLPRPEFKTLDGEAIFPEDDEPWWLTEVSKRISDETDVVTKTALSLTMRERMKRRKCLTRTHSLSLSV